MFVGKKIIHLVFYACEMGVRSSEPPDRSVGLGRPSGTEKGPVWEWTEYR